MSALGSLAPGSSEERRRRAHGSHHAANTHIDQKSKPLQSKTEYQKQLEIMQQGGTQQLLSGHSDVKATKRARTAGALFELEAPG